MKKGYFKSLGLLLILVSSLLFACQNNNNAQTSEEGTARVPVEALSFTKTEDQRVYDAYISLKNAFVESNAELAKGAVAELSAALVAIDMQDDAALASKIESEADLKVQRVYFTELSNNLIAKFKTIQLEKGRIFVQRCPMANNGDGGEWLASESNIRNPYYGDEMMECGSVIEEISAK